MTGPAIEGYATWFGRWHFALTILLFLAGTALTAILAVNCIAAFSASLLKKSVADPETREGEAPAEP
jgi:hypothetical protein